MNAITDKVKGGCMYINKVYRNLFIWFLFSGCSSDTTFSSLEKNKKESDREQREVFGIDQTRTFDKTVNLSSEKPPTQYLLVVDNSVSMRKYIENVVKGFEKIPESTFPDRSEIGVITTMNHEVGNPSKTHQGINWYEDIELEPGFLELVNKQSIETFKNSNAPPDRKNKFQLDGCSSWIKPGEKNLNNESCIAAHLQIALSPVGCEPGMHSFKQFMELRKNTFKSGNLVQVVFLSDEPGAGCRREDLKKSCPNLNQLKLATKKNSAGIIDVRFHGVINDDDSKGCNYAEVIDENKGRKLDIKASEESYKSLIEEIATEKIPNTITVELASPASSINEITIDNEIFKGESYISENKITLKGVPEREKLRIKINYFVK